MRTLIIENDAASQAAIEKVVKSYGDCQAAQDRETAMALFSDAVTSGRPFTLVTIEIALPDMQGNEIISMIREIENACGIPPDKKACLVVITGMHSRQLVTDCMLKGCNEFMAKPLDASQLLGVLVQFDLIGGPMSSKADDSPAVDGRKLVSYIDRKIKSGDMQLPPAPRVAMKIRQLVGAGAEIDAIVELLRQDPSISTKLISISNSVAYGGVTKNTDIGQAVSRLGLDRTVEVVMSICCRGYFITSHAAYKKLVEDIWWHSLASAHATEMIVQERQLKVPEDLFSLGLLHDVGKLILIQAAGQLYKPKKYQTEFSFDALFAVMDEYQERLGVLLLQKWGYDKAFAALIQHRRANRNESPSVAAQVLHQADMLATAAGFGGETENAAEISEALTQLGYPVAQQTDLTARIAARMEQLRYLFG